MKFIQTLISRFLSKNPVWVTRLQWLLVALAALLELPALLEWLTIPVPIWWDFAASKIATLISLGVAVGLQPVFVKKSEIGENPVKPPKQDPPNP